MDKANLENCIERESQSNREYIEAFCRHLGVELTGMDWTAERGFYERMYFFSDELGGYTIEGIIGSLLHE